MANHSTIPGDSNFPSCCWLWAIMLDSNKLILAAWWKHDDFTIVYDQLRFYCRQSKNYSSAVDAVLDASKSDDWMTGWLIGWVRLFGNYKLPKVETWHASAVWYGYDTRILLIERNRQLISKKYKKTFCNSCL